MWNKESKHVAGDSNVSINNLKNVIMLNVLESMLSLSVSELSMYSIGLIVGLEFGEIRFLVGCFFVGVLGEGRFLGGRNSVELAVMFADVDVVFCRSVLGPGNVEMSVLPSLSLLVVGTVEDWFSYPGSGVVERCLLESDIFLYFLKK